MANFESRLRNSKNEFKELFIRYPGNPILTAKDWPYPVNTVFNPSAVLFKGKTLLLAQVEDRRGFSHLTTAVSENGENNWLIDNKPTLEPDPDHPEELWGIEDSRITYVKELDRYAVVYTAYSESGPVVSLALTSDFIHFDRMGSIMPPEDKDAALFPRRFNGKWVLVHRPISHGAHIWISYSDNLKYWGDHNVLINSRDGSWWDAHKVGLCTPPMETKEGWLVIYHGVKQTAAGFLYRLGIALLDPQNPSRVIRRSDEWIFGPKESYEKYGDVPDVVFPCGWVLEPNTKLIRLYYGGADTCICLATAQLNDVLDYIMSCPKPK
jgi:predicted GH43/DUF377 family glycosyl hydrolase